MFVLDSHCDTPSQILRLRDIALDNPYAHVDIPKLRRGGVDGVFFALYVPSSFDADPEAARAYAYRMLTGVHDALKEHPQAVVTTSVQQALKNKSDIELKNYLLKRGIWNFDKLAKENLIGFYKTEVKNIKYKDKIYM